MAGLDPAIQTLLTPPPLRPINVIPAKAGIFFHEKNISGHPDIVMAGLDPAIHASPNSQMDIRMIKTAIPLTALTIIIVTTSIALANTPTFQPARFIGCNSDGQTGPIPAPTDDGTSPLIPKTLASRLAYYRADQGVGTLAPRGWSCFGYYGSSGNFLIISPNPACEKDYAATIMPSITGPAIQIRFSDAETSGRFDVATTLARLFPSQRTFVEHVIAEHILPVSDFPFGPYPNDIVSSQNKYDVAFETPANKDGMGTDDKLQKNNDPILGEAFIVGEGKIIDGVITLDVRLPPKLRYLAPIIFSSERKSAKPPTGQ